ITAVARDGSIVRSTDGGENWALVTKLVAADCRSISFIDAQNGFISGNSTDRNDPRGYIITTNDGGASWSSRITLPATQHLYGVAASGLSQIWTVASNGVIMHTSDGGATWTTQPKGQINVGVIDNAKSFVFLGLPLHILQGSLPLTDPNNDISQFLYYVMVNEFGL
ncbi:MAG TPA: YCF48-related protein, partial [Bacteroidota bacterium]|nr:YCF48-related protein [Bacteroidota bacterium]